MGQKVNPISLRLQQTNREFDNCWYTDYFYKKLISRDIYLQQYINNFLKQIKCPSARFSIQYSTKNSKLSSFLCYPMQSRMHRSRLFGLSFAKNRKSIYKKTNLSSKRQKSLKFLINNRLWPRVSFFFLEFLFFNKKKNKRNCFNMRKKEVPFFSDKKLNQLNSRSLNNIYSTLLLRTYTNKNISTFKNYYNKSGFFILPTFLQSKKELYHNLNNNSFLLFFTNKKENVFLKKNIYIKYNIKYNKNNNLLHFLKRLITTLFFVRILKTSSGLLFSKKEKTNNFFSFEKKKEPVVFYSFLVSKKEHKKRIVPLSLKQSIQKIAVSFLTKKEEINKKQFTKINNFNLEYRKNFLKFFLVFYILYTEYNKNTTCSFFYKKKDPSSLFLFEKNKKYKNEIKSNFVINNSISTKQNILKPRSFLQSKKEGLLNSFGCFSIFQPNYIFHTTFQKKTPLQLLLQHSTNYNSNNSFLFLFKNKKQPTRSYSFLQSKKEIQSKKEHPSYEVRSNPSYFVRSKPIVYNKENQLVKLKYKNYIQDFLTSQFNINVEFSPFIVSQDWQSAGFLADEIVYFLERRVPFRRLKHKILKKITEIPRIRGVRISCSGRVGGKSKKAQRAKTECVKYGQISRHTFSSRIDFAARTARTIFGSVGIKVWICYN